MDASVTPDTVTTGERAAWVQAWASIVGVLIAGAGVLFVIVQLWYANDQIRFAKEQYLAYKAERKTEKMEKLNSEWNSPTMLFYRANAAAGHPNGSAYIVEIFSFFERVSIAKNNGIISGDDISDYFQTPMLAYWCGFQDWVRTNRKQNGEDPNTGSIWSEYQKTVAQLQTKPHVQCMTDAEIRYIMKLEQDRYKKLTAQPIPQVKGGP
ncbi:MAG: hypothetical protein M3041_08090 [Acidobacteriota bacterium]|nr:hypothetical protein [Acidobacteriota bacterium]